MASTWSTGTTFQPPSYDEATGGISEAIIGGDLTFIDFLPDCKDAGGIFTKPKFDTFRALIDQGNEWLRTHPRWEVKTCESVEFKLKRASAEMNTQKMTYVEYGEAQMQYVRGLRLWVVPSINFGAKYQQIGFMNVVPLQTGGSSFFGYPSYENLSEVLQRFNNAIQVNPVPGKILNIETQEMKAHSLEIDPDRCSWTEYGRRNTHFIVVLRIFYEITSSVPEYIGVVDFIPEKLNDGGCFSHPTYEQFSSVINKASKWCREQTNIQICNAQSLEIKMKSGYEIDTQRMSYTEHAGRRTYYIRILRIAYVFAPNQMDNTENNFHQAPPPNLTCKTFVPIQLTSGFFVPDFETLNQTKTRIESWIKATGAQVLSAETAPMRLFTGGEARSGIEASYTYNRPEVSEYWIFVIRLYLNGFYHEPPSEVLPPIPEIENTNCCTVL